MGLGKTVQAIAAAEIMARLFGVGRVLVVCATSLKHQWQREIERFCTRTVDVIVGLRPRRERGFATSTFFKVMNYDTVHRELDMNRNLDQIGKTLQPILIRRHKQEVLEQLPGRIDNQIFVQMTPLQRKLHDENLEIVARIVMKWRDRRFLSESDRQKLMIALQRMR